MRLSNDFSWSFSRKNTFEECQKKYWYSYYGSWEGWPKTPYDSRSCIDPLAAHLYMLKQMQAVPTFVGSVVHNTIEHFLKQGSYTEDALQAHASALFKKGLEEAESGVWKKSPKKHTNLFEFYYKTGIDDQTRKQAEEKIARCITNWYRSDIVKQLLAHKDARIKSVEALEFFQLENKYKVIVVIDLALVWQDRTYILFDWKTGEESEKTLEQLYCYALFANSVWKVPVDQIILAPFYLFKNSYQKIGAKQQEQIDPLLLQRTQEGIISSCDALSVIHKEQDPRRFAYTPDRNKCRNCPYKQVCEKAEYKDLGRDELSSLSFQT